MLIRPSRPRRAVAVPATVRRARRGLIALAATGAAVLGLTVAAGSAGAAPVARAGTYTNAVTDGYSIDFPDPSIIKGKDGFWYAYATGGPYAEDGPSDSAKIARSADMVHWQKVGPIFTADHLPSWAAAGTGFWAADIRYLNGHYVMYFVVPNTTASTGGSDPGIGVATAPSPAGPWQDALGHALVPPTIENGGYTSVIDPSEFTDSDGQRYLYWGSYGSGIRVVRLSADGLATTGATTQVASTRFEGSYVIHRGDWYYMFASSANCCAGPTTGYAVFAGRARSPLGPFVDAEGVPLLASRSGGTIVLAQNGNQFVGPGHNAIATDVTGQDWIVYHAVDRTHPYLDSSPGFTMRPTLIDRLDWIHGWPLARGGQGPSNTAQPAPVTTGAVSADFTADRGDLRAVAGRLDRVDSDPNSDAGGFARLDRTAALGDRSLPADQHVEADVRTTGASAVGVLARYRDQRNNVAVTIDPRRRQLRVTTTALGLPFTTSAALPRDFDPTVWHNVAVDLRGSSVTASVTDARLGDPYATVTAHSFGLFTGRRAGVVGTGDVDNVEAAAEYRPHTAVAPGPRIGRLDRADSDEFGHGLGAGWTWKNRNPDAVVRDGQLSWPTEDTDLSNPASVGQAGLLLRDEPHGDYTIETKLSIDTGVDTVRNFQQAGLVVYANDNELLRYSHVAAGTTRFMEFGKVTMANGVRAWGASIVGPPAGTTWLRLARTTDPRTGELDFRAGSSRDGRHWIWGATWTMPAGSHPRIGLQSQGSSPATDQAVGKATARFDYVRIYH